jgi:hypothetical protein
MNRGAVLSIVIFIACAGVVAIGLATGPGQRPAAAPVSPPHKWNYPPGSWVLVHEVFRQGSQVGESDDRYEITGRTPEAVTLRIESVGPKKESSTRIVGLKDELDAVEGATRLGTETVTVDGRAFACVLFKRPSGSGEIRFWLAPGMAWPVRTIDNDGTETREVVLTRISDTVTFGAGRLDCAVFAETRSGGGQVLHRATSWRNVAVPGHEVRREEQFEVSGEPVSITRLVAAYAVK